MKQNKALLTTDKVTRCGRRHGALATNSKSANRRAGVCVLLAIQMLIAMAPARVEATSVVAQGALANLVVYAVESGAAPNYTLRASVLSAEGAGIPNLPPEAFMLSTNEGDSIPATAVQPVNGGVAAMVVADLGGLNQKSPRGALYQQEVEGVIRQFIGKLQKSSPKQEDYAGLIATTGTGANKFSIVITPTTDLGLVSNSIEPIKQLPVQPTTALYDGLNKAIDLLASTPGIEQKRKVILVISDGADQKFSGDAILGNVPVRAREGKITIYTLQARLRTEVEAKNLSILATQSGGRYALMDTMDQKASPQIEALFSMIDSLRVQYALAFHAVRPQGDFTAKLTVSAGAAEYSQDVKFTSNLRLPAISLVSPAPDTEVSQPVSSTMASQPLGIEPIKLAARVEFPDGKPRPVSVEFRVDGKRIGESASEPYEFVWQPPIEVQADTEQSVVHTLVALVKDSWLSDQTIESRQVNITVKVPAKPAPLPTPTLTLKEAVTKTTEQDYVLLAVVGVVALAVLVLIVVLIVNNRRIRAQMADLQSLANRPGVVGAVMRAATRRLTPGKPVLAELEILQGSARGQMLPIDSDLCWIGRDADRCQVVITDDAASGQHCQVLHDPNGQFFLLDERSTNGTFLDQKPVPKGIRMPLQPGAMIMIGRTTLVLRVGRGTQRLAQSTQRVGL